MIKKILKLIEESGVLMRMPRSHKKFLGDTFDTVASHSHHVAIIAYCLARMEKLSHDEALKCVGMAVFHDLAEARTGDFDFVAKHYGRTDEEKVREDQLEGVGFGEDLKNLVEEYEKRESLVSRCVKDADSLEQIYQEWILVWQGNKMAQKWFESDFKDRVPGFWTESARKIALEMRESDPQDWWWTQFIDEDGSAKDLEKLIGKK